MSPTLAADITATTLTSEMVILGALLVCVSAVVGFVAGIFYEKAAAKRAVQRAKKHLSRLITVVVRSLEAAHEACSALEKFPGLALSSKQLKRLEGKQTSLLETVNRVIGTQQTLAQAVAEQAEPKTEPVEFQLEWQRESEDARNGIPDRAVFDTNLQTLLDAGRASNVNSGLLLIKVDKFDQLQSRYGTGVVEDFLRKLAAVVSRAGRDEDLLCRYSTDTLALLMPQLDALEGRVQAAKIRDSVRNYHFRTDETGPEVLVTASFGYTVCDPADNRDLVVNRAGNAVAKSERRGRNQLHHHDGSKAIHCLAG